MLICQAYNISILHYARFFMCLTGKHCIFTPFFTIGKGIMQSLDCTYYFCAKNYIKLKNTLIRMLKER